MALSPWPARTATASRAAAIRQLGAALGEGDDAVVARLGAVSAALVEKYAPAAPQADQMRSGDSDAPAGCAMRRATGRASESEGDISTTFTPSSTGALRASPERWRCLSPVEGATRRSVGVLKTFDAAIPGRDHATTRDARTPGFVRRVGAGTDDADEKLRASVQPLALTDADVEGGVQLQHRIKCFVLPRRERVSLERSVLLFNGDALTLRGDPLLFFAGFEVSDRHALAAAFEQAGADKVIIDGAVFVVEESRTWPNYTRATLLRET